MPWFHQSVDGINKIMHFVKLLDGLHEIIQHWNSHWHLVSGPEISAVVSHLAGQGSPSPRNSDFSHLPLTIPFFSVSGIDPSISSSHGTPHIRCAISDPLLD